MVDVSIDVDAILVFLKLQSKSDKNALKCILKKFNL